MDVLIISKHLDEPGNKQKLEDALHVMEFISTDAGQKAIMSSTNIYMTPLNNGEMAEDNPYQEVSDIINSGHSMQMVFVGWEDMICPIAENLRELFKENLSVDNILEKFDTTYKEVIKMGTGDTYGEVKEKLTYEKTAELCAIAEGKAADADCAMVSLNEYHGDDNYNNKGVGWYLWKGKINSEKVQMIRPDSDTISVLELTGAEIKKMQAAGFDYNENGKPYDYLLFTKGGIELNDAMTYRMAISTNKVPEETVKRQKHLRFQQKLPLRNILVIWANLVRRTLSGKSN